MNNKQRKTLERIFSRPTPKNLLWNDIESLILAIGGTIIECEGSRVAFRYIIDRVDGQSETIQGDFHRPHPGKEAKPYQIKKVILFLTKIGIIP